jgi:hypothetical protein
MNHLGHDEWMLPQALSLQGRYTSDRPFPIGTGPWRADKRDGERMAETIERAVEEKADRATTRIIDDKRAYPPRLDLRQNPIEEP